MTIRDVNAVVDDLAEVMKTRDADVGSLALAAAAAGVKLLGMLVVEVAYVAYSIHQLDRKN